MDIEIQQRSVEYSQFWSLSGDQRVALLEAIPVLESASKEEGQKGLGADPSFSPSNDNRNTADLIGGDSKPVVSKPKDDLYDLMFGGDAPVSQVKTKNDVF